MSGTKLNLQNHLSICDICFSSARILLHPLFCSSVFLPLFEVKKNQATWRICFIRVLFLHFEAENYIKRKKNNTARAFLYLHYEAVDHPAEPSLCCRPTPSSTTTLSAKTAARPPSDSGSGNAARPSGRWVAMLPRNQCPSWGSGGSQCRN